MSIEELLKKESIGYVDLIAYITAQGMENIKVKDLNRLIDHSKGDVLNIAGFDFIYNVVSSNESNKVITRWTITTGILTIIVTIATVMNLVLFAGTL